MKNSPELVMHNSWYANYSMLNKMYTIISFTQYTLDVKQKDPILIQFGAKVKFYRKEQGVSQEELAHKAGVHRTYIGMIERAEKNITLLNAKKIASALNVHLKDLLCE